MTQNNGRWIPINGKKLYIEFQTTYENRPTLVFLHDSLGCTSLWRDFPQKLAEAIQCNVLVYDRLGYGKSDPMPTHERPINYLEAEAHSLDSLLNALAIDNAILFGHSDGGSIALITASRYGKKIKAVICEAAHIFVEELTLKGIRGSHGNLPKVLTFRNDCKNIMAITLKHFLKHGQKPGLVLISEVGILSIFYLLLAVRFYSFREKQTNTARWNKLKKQSVR
jgi:pimeloyl-ACP methyl ester carboxylesterase